MRYDGKINRKLSLIKITEKRKIFPDKVEYKLAYGKAKHLSFSNEEILDYINENYIKNDDIIEENLLNDLITFKTFKTDREVLISHFDIIQNGLAIFIAAIIGAISFSATCLSSEYILKNVIDEGLLQWIIIHTIGIVVMALVFYVTIALFRVGKNSANSDLKFIDNVIYTLETIKEDMYRNGNWCTESDEIKSSVNDKPDDGNTENIATEDADDGDTENITTEDANERYKGLELTEVKEIRTYTYKATKNKYSPRAMYERKRR